MGPLTKIFLLVLSAGAVFIGIKINSLFQDVEPPILENTWWGPGKPGRDNNAIVPFKISVPDEILLDLNYRLEHARPLTPALEGVAQDYGMNSKLLQEILDFWKTKYDWKQREKFLNKYPQFTTQIQGLDIHYIHVKPANPKNLKVIPLLLLHGWPGSVREFYEIIPMLTKPHDKQDFVFEAIIPSLPGYGFSQAAAKPGLGAPQMAVVFKNLMKRLGFEKYYVQGGDWGSFITSSMAVMFKDRVLGIHLNMCTSNLLKSRIKFLLGSIYPPMIVGKEQEKKLYPLSNYFYGLLLESGYFHLQATKPDTVGFGLNDSPIGLAAYILEKFTTGTNSNWKSRVDGGLQIKFAYEDLLDNVMIYWVTNSITTSVRLYAETTNIAQMKLQIDSVPVRVPVACANMEYDLGYRPDCILKDRYPQLIQSNYYKDVGHFAAFEEPKILSDDIWSAVQKMEKLRN